MQNVNNKDGKLIGITYDSVIKKIRNAESIKEKLEWFVKLPLVFWTFESMKQILGPVATMGALKVWDSYDCKHNFQNLDVVYENKKVGVDSQFSLHAISGFLKRDTKIKLSDFGNLSQEQISDSLYCLINEGIIENTQELKKYCDSDLGPVLGDVILKLILEDLEFMFENKDKNKDKRHSEIARKFGITDDLITLVIINYISYVSDEYAHCHEIENHLKTEEEKWMAKVVLDNKNIIDIRPIYILRYFALKSIEDYKCGNDDMYEISETDLYKLFLDAIDNRFSGWNLDFKRKVFLILCTMRSVWGFSLKRELKKFLDTLEWDEEEIFVAFTQHFINGRYKNYEHYDFENFRFSFQEDVNFLLIFITLGMGMLRPVIRAIINGTKLGRRYNKMEAFLYGVLVSSEPSVEDFKSGIEVCFSEINKLSDYKKITSIVAFVELKSLIKIKKSDYDDSCYDELFSEALCQKNGRLKDEIKKIFDSAFEKGILSDDLRSCDLLKIIKHREILGLTNEQIRLIHNKALELDRTKKDRTKKDNKKLFKLFDTKELKVILEDKSTENKILVGKNVEAEQEKTLLNLKEDFDKDKIKDGYVPKPAGKKLVSKKIKNKSKPNMMLDKKRYRDQEQK